MTQKDAASCRRSRSRGRRLACGRLRPRQFAHTRGAARVGVPEGTGGERGKYSGRGGERPAPAPPRHAGVF